MEQGLQGAGGFRSCPSQAQSTSSAVVLQQLVSLQQLRFSAAASFLCSSFVSLQHVGSPVLAGEFFTSESPGKSSGMFLIRKKNTWMINGKIKLKHLVRLDCPKYHTYYAPEFYHWLWRNIGSGCSHVWPAEVGWNVSEQRHLASLMDWLPSAHGKVLPISLQQLWFCFPQSQDVSWNGMNCEWVLPQSEAAPWASGSCSFNNTPSF